MSFSDKARLFGNSDRIGLCQTATNQTLAQLWFLSIMLVTTFRGKGVIDEDHELYAGSHGTIGSTNASKLIQTSDLLIVIGASFSDMTQIPEKRTVQIDMDPMIIAKNYSVEVGLWGNCSEIVPDLISMTIERKDPEYLAEMKTLKKQWSVLLEKEADASKKPIRPQYIIKVLNEKMPHNAVISLMLEKTAGGSAAISG